MSRERTPQDAGCRKSPLEGCGRGIILASSSPQRKALLEEAGFDVTVAAPEIDERIRGDLSPAEHALALARAKARQVAGRVDDGLVLGADTVGSYEGKIIGKPADEQDARRILGELSGTTHECITAICLVDQPAGKEYTEITRTVIVMEDLTDEMIGAYVASGESTGKAGAYAIQEKGDRFVKRLDGSFSNVVGLPMETLARMLSERDRDAMARNS